MGALALASLLSDSTASSPAPSPQSPVPARVKRVIWLFMHGGPSHVDLLDPKPDLIKLAGKPLPESFGPVMTRRKVAQNPLLGRHQAVPEAGPERAWKSATSCRTWRNVPTTCA